MGTERLLDSVVLRSRLAAARMCAQVLLDGVDQLVADGADQAAVSDDLRDLWQRSRDAGDTVVRDALTEVLDELDDRTAA